FFRQCIECCTQRSIPDDHELDAVLRFADGRRGDQIDWTLLWNQLPSETNSPWTGLSYRRPISCECILEKWSVNRIRRVVKFLVWHAIVPVKLAIALANDSERIKLAKKTREIKQFGYSFRQGTAGQKVRFAATYEWHLHPSRPPYYLQVAVWKPTHRHYGVRTERSKQRFLASQNNAVTTAC